MAGDIVSVRALVNVDILLYALELTTRTPLALQGVLLISR